MFPVHLSSKNEPGIKAVTKDQVEDFLNACDAKGLKPTAPTPPPPPPKEKKDPPRSSASSSGSINQVQAFSGTTEDSSRGRQKKRNGRNDRKDRSRSRSNEVYTGAATRLAERMKAAKTIKEKDKVFRGFHTDVLVACGNDADKLWRNKKLENRGTPLLQPKTWFLKKHVDWPESVFRLMMLYKDACGAEPKDLSYAKVEGLDEALKPWRANSALAKWLRGE